MSLNIQIIRDSFEQAKPIAGDVANKFYEFLWSDYPQSKDLFANVKMEEQKKALINSLIFIVDNLENSEKHYQWVGASLLKTFSHFFGERRGPQN